MAAVITWNDYIEYLEGREPPIPQSDFANIARKTLRCINQRTANGNIPDEIFEEHRGLIIDVFCQLAELIYIQEEHQGLTAVSITGHSQSFDKDNTDTRRIISQLWPTGLLYRGV